MTKQTYTYGAFTANQDGSTFEHVGTPAGAIRKAKIYARETFPAWTYKGYGPTIIVRDASGQDLHRERL